MRLRALFALALLVNEVNVVLFALALKDDSL